MDKIKFDSKEDLNKWNQFVENVASIVELAKSEKNTLTQFCSSEMQSAKFWDRYAKERSGDSKLKEIAKNELDRVTNDVEMLDGVSVDMFEKVALYLKSIQTSISK